MRLAPDSTIARAGKGTGAAICAHVCDRGSDFVQGQKGLSNARALRLFLEQRKCLPHEIMRSQASGTSGMTQGLLSLAVLMTSGVTGNCLHQASFCSTQNEDAAAIQDQRAKFSVNYWRHMWQKTEKAYVSPLGHGLHFPNAQVVYTEDFWVAGPVLWGVTEDNGKRSRVRKRRYLLLTL